MQFRKQEWLMLDKNFVYLSKDGFFLSLFDHF